MYPRAHRLFASKHNNSTGTAHNDLLLVSSLLLQTLTRKNVLGLRRRHPTIRGIQFTGFGGCLLSFRDLPLI